jgi:hypothetical protein
MSLSRRKLSLDYRMLSRGHGFVLPGWTMILAWCSSQLRFILIAMAHLPIMCATLLVALLPACQSAVDNVSAGPAQIIVIRHAEKPRQRGSLHLSMDGEKRAASLVSYFNRDPELLQHGPPVALFATAVTKSGRGQRPGETLEPLAKSLGLPIERPFHSDDYQRLAKEILSNRKLTGKTVVICWTHEFIPPLLNALGVRPVPAQLSEDVYDRVYLITYVSGKARLRELQQPRVE